MNKRLKQLIENQEIRGGQWLDCYNQQITDIAGTIRTTVDHSNMFFTTEEMKTKEPQIEVQGTLNEGVWAKRSESDRRVYSCEGIAPTQGCCEGGGLQTKVAEPTIGAIRTRSYCGQPMHIEQGGTESNTITSVQKDNVVIEPKCDVVAKLEGGKWDKSLDIMRRVYGENGLAPTQHCVGGGNMETKVAQNFRIRKLTPRECFRLMDVSDADIDKIQAAGISKSQQYKLAGNSIVVACLEGIFRRMLIDTEPTELKLFY